jgi:hypothetical protein
MNDSELNELLDKWKTPAVPASMREKVGARIAVNQRKPLWARLFGWRPLAAATAVVAIAVVLADTYAFSTKATPPPFTVESEIIRHDDLPDCLTCWISPVYPGPKRALMTSYSQAGSEMVLSWSAVGKLHLPAALWSAKLAVSGAFNKLRRIVPLMPELEPTDYYAVIYTAVNESRSLGGRDDLLRYSCRPTGRSAEVIGEEVVLDYPTVVVRDNSYKSRMTLWMSPELSCFALRAIVEAEQPDGTWTLLTEKKALKVTMKEAGHEFRK